MRIAESAEEVDAFIVEHAAGLTRLARVLALDTAAAEDLAQQALLRVFERWEHVRAARNREAYVRQILINEFRTTLRQRKARPEYAVGLAPMETVRADQLVPDNGVEERSEAIRLLRVVGERQRAALALRYLEDRTDGEIAEILGCRKATVRSLIRRGLRAIRAAEQVAGTSSAQEVR